MLAQHGASLVPGRLDAPPRKVAGVMSAFEEKELNKLAEALAALTPRPAHLDRDGLLYEAGRRSVRPSRFWPVATLVLGVVACGLTVALFVRPESSVRWIHSVQPAAQTPHGGSAPEVTAVDVGVPMPVTDDGQSVASRQSSNAGHISQAAARLTSATQLKELATALHQYHDAFKSYPPPANLDQQNRPLLSWRVHLLPFNGNDNLYKQFKLDEPWDSDHNKKLIPLMPKVYKSPLAKNVADGNTVYLAPAGPGMIFEGPKSMSTVQISDGVSNTILLVEANDDNSVTWTKPDDYRPEKTNPAAPLVRKDMKGFPVAMADGTVRMVSNTVNADLLWSCLTAAGGEAIDLQKLGQE